MYKRTKDPLPHQPQSDFIPTRLSLFLRILKLALHPSQNSMTTPSAIPVGTLFLEKAHGNLAGATS